MEQDHRALHNLSPAQVPAAGADQIVLGARQVEVVIARLMLRVPASESMEFGLAQCKAAVAALGDRYAVQARAGILPCPRT